MDLKKIFENYWVRNYPSNLLAGLTLLFITSVAWNLYQNKEDTKEKARIEARAIFQHNLAYRRWNAMHGGVYAKITKYNQPNEYLLIPNRDIVSTTGEKYTTINPYQMTSQAYALLHKQSPSLAPINRTVSLHPLNPENAPDAWEGAALLKFEEGVDEVFEITQLNNMPYMRLLTPYIAEERCLKCHGNQGYKAGDIRGGMSIAVPMQPYYEAAVSTKMIIIVTHLLLWMLGACTIIFFSKSFRKYQNAISKSEEKFRIVSEFACNFECWTDANNNIKFISPSCERITGYTREEFVNNPKLLTEMIHPDDREHYNGHIIHPEGELLEDLEYRIITKNGEMRWLSHNCTPIYVDGQFLGRRRSNKDITDKKKLEEQLLQSQKMECLGRFACGIAHDFNNTLSTITTFTHLLQDEIGSTNENADDYVKYISLASKLGKNLTSNLLSFGRRQISERQTIKLSHIINNISDILKVLATEDIECKVSIGEDELPVLADSHQIEQVLINLSNNAIDAMPDGGEINISIQTLTLDKKHFGNLCEVPPGKYMLLTVSDTGVGISSENLTEICKPFFTTKQNSKAKGTGLGLSIIDNIINEHDGLLDVESSIGKGAKFCIYLPVSSDQKFTEKDSEKLLAADRNIKIGPGTILLAEDDELARKSLDFLLKHMGFEVILAEDGEEAVALYGKNKDLIDMVVLDFVLPKMNGREVYDLINQDENEIKVLFVSGYTDDILSSKGIYEGGFDFVQKPLDVDVFIAKVQNVFNRSA